jgi:hypothetical protein
MGTKITANDIIKGVGNFRKHCRMKRPVMVMSEWFFHWDNTPTHSATGMKKWMATNNIQLLQHSVLFATSGPGGLVHDLESEGGSGLLLTQESLNMGLG